MKTLYIIRHAKSSWTNPLMDDFDRPLNKRGELNAPHMGKRLKEKRIVPDLMLSSPAKRALSTCEKIADVLNYSREKIKTDKDPIGFSRTAKANRKHFLIVGLEARSDKRSLSTT